MYQHHQNEGSNTRDVPLWTDRETEAYYFDKLPAWAREILREQPIEVSAEDAYYLIKSNRMGPAEFKKALDENSVYWLNETRDILPEVTSPEQFKPLVPVKKSNLFR